MKIGIYYCENWDEMYYYDGIYLHCLVEGLEKEKYYENHFHNYLIAFWV